MAESQVELYQRLRPTCICTAAPMEHCDDEACPSCSQLDPEWPCIMDVLYDGEIDG